MNAAQTLHLALPQFQIFSILLVRIAGIISVFPILNTRTIPTPVKAGLVTMLGLVLRPIIQLPKLPSDPVTVVAGIGSEFLIGLTIGLAVRLLFSGFQSRRRIGRHPDGIQRHSIAGPHEPSERPAHRAISADAGVLGVSLAQCPFAGRPCHRHELRTRAAFRRASLSDSIARDIIQLAQNMLGVALKLAAPMFATLLIVNAILAILGRAVPQMNIFVLSFPITIGAGLVAMSLAMPFTLSLFEQEFMTLAETILALLKALGHG